MNSGLNPQPRSVQPNRHATLTSWGLWVALCGLMLGQSPSASLCAADAAGISLSSLLDEMADRDALARWPQPQWTLHQVTSHDVRKKDPADLAGWHSNDDGKAFIRLENHEGRKEWVIAEDHGPGAITRIWNPLCAAHGEPDHTTVRFYFDGASTPTITANFLDLIAGQDFIKPPMAFTATDRADFDAQQKKGFQARMDGADLYLPIPFARGFKITLEAEPFYYSVTYRLYPEGTPVKSFTRAEFADVQEQVRHTSASLMEDGPEPQHLQTAVIAAGGDFSLPLPVGPAAVRVLSLEIDPKDAAAMRTTVIAATFDGEQCIWCPLSEFFGTGVRFLPIRDRFRSVDATGRLTSHWTMPYHRSGVVALHNGGATALTVHLGVVSSPWSWDERSMHFHGSWHGQSDIATRPISDWNFITIMGRGVYVGDTLTVYSPAKEWYGEGDERIMIDADRVASMIGTGTEDYFGCAWGMPRQFSSPFISAPRRDHAKGNKDDWRGYTTDSRMRQMDRIPFTTLLKHDLEIWDWADTKVDYAVGLFWYGIPGATSNRVPQPELTSAPLRADALPFVIPGAHECETLAIIERSAGLQSDTQHDILPPGSWSADTQLFVHGRQPGDRLVLAIPVPDDQPHHVVLYATRAVDYGILRFTIDGKPAGQDFDGYRAQAAISGPIQLGSFSSKTGTLRLGIEVIGANPAATGARYLFGLDCVTLSTSK